MQRSARKNPRLVERLNAIQREMARIDSDIKTVSQVIDHPERAKALQRLKRPPVEQEGLREATVERRVPREDVFEPSAETSGVSVSADNEADFSGCDTGIPKAPADQRFVNYFVTGGLHSVRPLRQERRVQRNKAIFMLVIAALVLFGVISMLFRS